MVSLKKRKLFFKISDYLDSRSFWPVTVRTIDTYDYWGQLHRPTTDSCNKFIFLLKMASVAYQKILLRPVLSPKLE